MAGRNPNISGGNPKNQKEIQKFQMEIQNKLGRNPNKFRKKSIKII